MLVLGNECEIVVLCILVCECLYVLFEYVLFGFGLINLYCVLCELCGSVLMFMLLVEVICSVLVCFDEVVVEVLEMFCGLFGSFVGDLVLFYGVCGGVFFVGGILL